MEHAKDSADEKIAFNKTWLFTEGKGDNELFEIPDVDDQVLAGYRLPS
jgi:hypothetical protein